MTILFYKTNEILPFVGGVSRINYILKESLICYGYKILYLSSTKKNNIEADECQLWLPNLVNEHSQENISFLHKLLIEEKVDVIVNNEFNICSFNLLDKARQGTSCKLISWIHNNIVEYGSLVGFRYEKQLRDKHLGLLYRIITCSLTVKALRYLARQKHTATAQELYRQGDRVLTVCDGNIKEFLFLLGHQDNDKKLVSIPNFVPMMVNEVIEEEKLQSVVWCGTVDYDLKKTNWMLEIWRSIQAEHPEWTLTIMGDGKQLESIKRYANQIGVDRVIFTGRVNVNPYYRKASILCSTSISESFGLTIVEGMQHRVVPIAFASSASIRNIVGYNGKLVKPYDKKLFAKELSDLIKDDAQRRFLAEKGRIAAMQYEETQIIKLWQKLLEVI